MSTPYDAVLKKYGKGSVTATIPQAAATSPEVPAVLPSPTIVPALPAAPIKVTPVAAPAALKGNPYASVVSKYQTQKKQAGFDAGTAATEKALAPESLPAQVIGVAKAVPGAAVDIAKTAVTHPVQAAESAVLGAMDVGPAIVNAIVSGAHGLGNKIRSVSGQPALPPIGKLLPLPGETFNDYMGRGDALSAITEGAKQGAGYELGGGVASGAGLTGLTKEAVGNVIGGQFIADPNASLKDRAKQAAFDATFSAALHGAGSVTRALRGVKAEIPSEIAKGSRETPAAEAVKTAVEAPAAQKGTETPGPTIGGRKIAKIEPPKPTVSDVVYVPKKDLGLDPSGQKVLATTEYSTKTGKAIVYYSKELDSNPDLRTTVLDHEIGHVVDKRVNAGRNISAELTNPTANETALRNVLGPYARQTGQTITEAAAKLSSDIEKLSSGHGSTAGEKFANAYAKYKADPIAAAKEAPAFDSFMKHTPVEKTSLIQSRSLTAEGLKKTRKPVEPISARKARIEQNQSLERGSETTTPSSRSLKRSTSEAPTSRREPSGSTKATLKSSREVKSTNQTLSSNRKKFLSEFDIKNPDKVTLAKFYEGVKKQSANFKGTTSDIASRSGGDGYVYRLKTSESIATKIKRGSGKGRTLGSIGDVHGSTVLTNNVDRALSYAKKKYKIQKVDDFRKEPTFLGYSGLHVDVELPNGMHSEIQIMSKDYLYRKEMAHKVYDKWRGVLESSKTFAEAAQKISKEKFDEFTADVQKSKDIYGGKVEVPAEIKKTVDASIVQPKTRRTAPPNYKQTAKPGSGRIAETGLRTGKGVNTKSFNASKIDSPDDVKTLFEQMAGENKNFASQRLSKGNEDIKDLARLTGLTEDELIAARPGSIANSETTTAARQLVLNKAQNLLNTLKGIDVSTAKPSELKMIRDEFVKLVSMQKAVAGFRTEASNVFRSLGLELAPGENATLAELAGILKEAGVASEDDAAVFAGKVAKQATLTRFEKGREAALATWYAAILSGPKTTARNILSTGSNILTEVAAKSVNPRQWNEVIPSITGLIRGLKMGLGEARDVMHGAHDTGKFMETGRNVTQPEIFTGKAATYGRIVESVGRFLNAQDKLLSAGAREMERASLKAKGLEVSKAVEDAVTKAYAERTVYHGKPTGGAIGALRDAAQALRKKFPAAKFIVPFVDTVANVMDRQFDYIPITAALRLRSHVISEQASRIIKDFELKESDRVFIEQRIRDQQVGRLALGALVSTGAVMLAGQGLISGNGPANYSEKQQLMRTGWRPNSIKVGDVWIPYTYLGPLAGILSMAGNIHDKVEYDNAPGKDLTSLIGNGLVGWTQTQLNQSFLSGVADLFDVATGGVTPKAYLNRFISGLVPIPAAYSQTKDMIFRQQYQTSGIVDSLRLKLGLTEGMQPKLDQFGEPMTADLIYGITPSVENASKVDRFLISNDLIVAIPSRTTNYSVPGGGKEKRELTPAEYTVYVQTSGKQIYQELNRRIDELSSLSADKQKKTVQDIVDRIRTVVRGQVMRGLIK